MTQFKYQLDEKDLPNIFNRFYRCDQSRTAGGSGLGLSLAQTIAHAHHGDLRVASIKGKGSVFILSLPIDPPVEAKS